MRILIVDDNEQRARSLKNNFIERGYEVDTANNGSCAVDMVVAKEQTYDFVLMDQHLGADSTIDGLEATRLIANKGVRVIVYTVQVDRQASREALEMGAFRYVFAPFDTDYLVNLMENAEEIKEIENDFKNESPHNPSKMLIDDMEAGICVVDRSYRLLYINKKQQELSGSSALQGGTCWVELHNVPSQDCPCPWCPAQNTFRTGKPHTGVIMSLKEGEPRFFNMTASPVWNKDMTKVIAAVKMSTDVTEKEGHRRLMETVAATEDREVVYRAVLDQILSMGYRRARLFELSAIDNGMKCVIERGLDTRKLKDYSFAIQQDYYTENIARLKKPILQSLNDKHISCIFKEDTDVKQWIDIPILDENKFIGMITIDNSYRMPMLEGYEPKRPKELKEEDFNKLTKISSYAATAMRKCRQEEMVRKKAEQLEKLREMDAKLVNSRNQDNNIKTIIDFAMEFTKALSGYIRLAKGDKLVMEFGNGAYYNLGIKYPELGFANQPISCYSGSAIAFRDKQPYIMHKAYEDKYFRYTVNKINKYKDKDRENCLKHLSTKSFICYPLMVEETNIEPIGVLVLFSDKYGYFDDEMTQLIADFSKRATTSLYASLLITELSQKDEQIRTLFDRIAHSFNTPLQSMDGFITRLVSGLDTDEKDRQENYDVIFRQVKHFERGVQDLLNLVRGEEGKLNPFLRKVNINKLVVESVKLFIPQAESKRITININADSTNHFAFADSYMTEEIVQNLVCNAVLYTPKDGIVSVEVRKYEECIEIIVKDTGVGIPADELPKIFEKSFRGNKARKITKDGRGIGLTVCKMLTEAQNGSIMVSSEEGKGTIFWVKLPLYIE